MNPGYTVPAGVFRHNASSTAAFWVERFPVPLPLPRPTRKTICRAGCAVCASCAAAAGLAPPAVAAWGRQRRSDIATVWLLAWHSLAGASRAAGKNGRPAASSPSARPVRRLRKQEGWTTQGRLQVPSSGYDDTYNLPQRRVSRAAVISGSPWRPLAYNPGGVFSSIYLTGNGAAA
jgi:hypothetical protein